jgi:hypothetical protein
MPQKAKASCDSPVILLYSTTEIKIMKQFTPSEAKKLVKDLLAEKKKKAEYFQENGTLKGFASAK